MRRTTMNTFLRAVLVVTASAFSTYAAAGKLDLTLAGFVDCQGARCTPRLQEYETFLAEYAFGISPKKLAPAETLGFSGFYMGFEESLSVRPLGKEAETRWEDGTASEEVQTVTWNPGIHIRKGLPFSFELGSSINYLAISKLVSLGGEVKWSLFEGYRTGWRAFLPDIALRGSIVRVIGQSDIDMTLVGLDGSISYAFGVGGMITLTPYGGYQYIWTIANPEPLLYRDTNNHFHPEVGTTQVNVNSLGNPILGRSHIFFGLRIGYEILAFTVELDWGLPNKWTVDGDDLEAKVAYQIQISGGLGVDF